MQGGSIPPSPPPSLPPAAEKTIVQAAPVTSPPPAGLTPPATVEGRVIASTPREVTIATPQGDVTIRTAVQLPVGAQVSVDLYLQRAQWVADIAVLRQQNAMVRQALDTLQPSPAAPLKAGDVFESVFIPKFSAPPQGYTPEQILSALQKLPPAALQQLPPLPDGLKGLVTPAADWALSFQKLAPAQQQALISWMSQPAVLDKIKAFLPQITGAAQPSQPAGQGAGTTTDLDIITLLQKGLPAATTGGFAGQGKSTVPSLANAGALQNLLPLLETMASQSALSENDMRKIFPQLKDLTEKIPDNMRQVKILSIATQDGKIPPSFQTSATITGKAAGYTPAGFPIIQTNDGDFILKTSMTIEPGARVTIEAKPLTPQQMIAKALEGNLTGPVRPQALMNFWPALEETLQAISAASPQAAAALRNSIPSPMATQLPPAALLFLAAFRMGNLDGWLGDKTIDLLRSAGKQNLIDRLTGDFTRLSAQSKTQLPGDWRMVSLPMLHEDQISQLQFFVRQQHDQPEQGKEQEAEDRKPTTRFILNLNLSRMGDLQLDGLLRKKRFDIILRTADALPESMRRELTQAFIKGLEQANMEGGMSFQTKNVQWVTINDPKQEEKFA